MANEIQLESFPFDSMQVLNEESEQMEDDRIYEAEVFRKYFQMFLGNGVYFGEYKGYKENSMKVTSAGGMNITVATGAGMIEGANFENTQARTISLNRPATGNRVDRVIVQMNSSLEVRATRLFVKEGNGTTPAELQRNGNVYEICLAEITVKSTTNITQDDITDKRPDKEVCGIVNSLISVDGEELYQKFKNYIDSTASNFIRKDQNIEIDGDIIAGSIKNKNGKTFSSNDFTDSYKTKLDGISENANNYVHPAAHSASMITESSTKRFVTDTEKSNWNGKQKTITKGTANPSGGADGDIYIQYF